MGCVVRNISQKWRCNDLENTITSSRGYDEYSCKFWFSGSLTTFPHPSLLDLDFDPMTLQMSSTLYGPTVCNYDGLR